MKQKEISIIVPIYNAQLFLEETIQSLLNQTFKDIEIILVNDGSKDSSKQICEKYAKLDERILVVNKENGGLADARNAGLKIANGKYIMFLDADDLFANDACENMYQTIEQSQADYVIGNYQMMDEDGTKWSHPAFDVEKYQDFRIDLHDYQKSFFVMNSTAWNKIYKAQFLKENDITFKVPSPAEDAYFTSLCYIKAKYGFYTSKVTYWYRNSSDSLSKICSLRYFKGMNYAYQKIYENFKNNHELGHYRYLYAKINAYLVCQLIDSEQLTRAEKVECLKDFEWYFNLSEKLQIHIVHESLKSLMNFIKNRNYDNAILEMERLQEYRKMIPDNLKKRMSFPTSENYRKIAKYDEDFIDRSLTCLK